MWMKEFREINKAIEKASQARLKKHTRYGVFVYNEDNKYPKESALRLYKVQSAAEKYADKLNELPGREHRGYVVRSIVGQF
jgi:hypothetical protein